jgi:CBS domain containing-hemolysin-like protein
LDPALGLGLIALFVLLSAFFAAAETAINSLSPAKVRTLLEEKKPGAQQLDWLKKNYHRTLIAVLFGNQFVDTLAAAVATVLVTERFDSIYLGIVSGILTIVSLIFGEALPKSLASVHAQSVGLFLSPPIRVFVWILTPLVWLLDRFINLILRVLGSSKQAQVTDEELIAMASIGAEEGSIDEHELELIENALEFNDIPVEGIMTPRVHVDALPETFKLDEASEFVVHHTHTRIPVYRDNIDNIVGILSIKELLKQVHTQEDPEHTSLRQIKLLTPLKVSHSMKVQDLFRQFKKSRTHMAVVLDEYGGTLGIVTMEDLLEELVGEIEDEQDIAEENVKKLGQHDYELSGRTELDDLTELMEVEFTHPGYKTVSYFIIEELGHLPKEGQSVVFEGWKFTVLQMLRSTILKVRLQKI